jgi:hypothetical protein
MGVQKVILAERLQVERPSSDLAKNIYATSANSFQKGQLCVAPKMPHQPTFFKKLNYVCHPKICHISQLFSKSSTMCVTQKYATSANFFQKAQLCVTQKYATSANFFQKAQLCITQICHISQLIYQCHMANLFLPFKIGTSVCGMCSLSLSSVTLKKNYKFLILLKFA